MLKIVFINSRSGEFKQGAHTHIITGLHMAVVIEGDSVLTAMLIKHVQALAGVHL